MAYKKFETELVVRPDDIDMNNHVHNSKYLDYVLAARFDQMGRCYGMSMNDFIAKEYSWYQKLWHIEYKRAIELTDRVVIRTWLDSFEKADVRVNFVILKGSQQKVSAEGYFISTLINLQTGRAEAIPEWIIQHYTRFTE